MENTLSTLNWSLIQSFLAVAEEGSLSAAARRLGASQPTLGRQIRQIEAQLGVSLFQRQPRGLNLTPTGVALLEPAKAMQAAMGQIAMTAAGQEENIKGTVRITASVFVAQHFLPQIIAHIRRTEPQISIELVASDTSENLLFHEADIALRMYRPEQLDVVTRHLGDMPLGMFAATKYLDRKGRPRNMDQLLNEHDLIGYDQDETLLRGMREMGIPAEREWFCTRCDDNVVNWKLVRAGCGIGFSQAYTALRDELVEQVLPEVPIPALPVWLTAHQAMRKTPRIRRVWDILAEGIKPFVS